MKKLIYTAWMVALLTTANSIVLCSNIETLLPARMSYSISSLEAVWKSCPRLSACRMATYSRGCWTASRNYIAIFSKILQPTCSLLTEIDIGSNIAIQNPCSKLWDIYGVITAILPKRRYYIRTSCNRCFLRRCVPLSIPMHMTRDRNADLTTQDLSAEQTTQELCRSVRTRQPPNRLIKDPTWHQYFLLCIILCSSNNAWFLIIVNICDLFLYISSSKILGGRCKIMIQYSNFCTVCVT